MKHYKFFQKSRADLAYDIFQTVVLAICLIILIHIVSGCSTTATAPVAPSVPKYELTLAGTIDGKSFQGVGVGSSSAMHAMTIKSPVAVNYFTMDSCHRSIQFSDIIKFNWYEWATDSKSFSWIYQEAPNIETDGDCILRFCAFSKTVGSAPVSCAIVDFKADKYDLPGTNICNGTTESTTGTAICQTKVGLLERFQFDTPVIVAPQVLDPTGKTAPYWIAGQCVGKFLDADQTLFQYETPENECTLIFMEKAEPHRRAKLSVIPFDTALYPGGS